MGLPPSEIPQGAIRFNTDSQKLEFYAQDQWWEMVIDTPNLAVGSNTTAGARGVWGGGRDSGGQYNIIEYINISTAGNAIDFGDLNAITAEFGACASSTRGVWGGGEQFPANINNVQYITISSTGNALDFGDLTQTRRSTTGSCSSATRGVWCGGSISPVATIYNIIDYVTIATTGNANDFGDLAAASTYLSGCASPTRGVIAGGNETFSSPYPSSNRIQFITIATTGNTQDFGDLAFAVTEGGSVSNSTRGVFIGGNNPTSGYENNITYVTISTTGNATDFGNLRNGYVESGAVSSSTTGVFGDMTADSNVLSVVSITVGGIAVDFGDLTAARNQTAACSNAHGGL